MKTFKIEDIELVAKITEYHIEAETAQEALDLYCEKLAGTLPVIRRYTRPMKEGDIEDVTVNPTPIID
jgi:hypothetical protein